MDTNIDNIGLIEDIWLQIKGGYLTGFAWLVVALIFGCYIFALMLGNALSGTWVSRCRKAWSIAFGIHAIITLGYLVYWYEEYGVFSKFLKYFSWYCALLFIDIILALLLFIGQKRFASYQ